MRILLAVKRSDLRIGMEMLLDEQTGLKVIGSIADTAGLLELVKTAQPDLVVLDWDLPGKPLAGMFDKIRDNGPRPAIIVLGGKDTDTEQAALAVGADAYISKGDPPAELLATIRRAYDRHYPSRMVEG